MSEWIEWSWTEDKPYPETLDTLVYVKWGDSYEDKKPRPVSDFIVEEENCFDSFLLPEYIITHYRIAP